MVCEKCGKELADDAALCTSCGWKTQKWSSSIKEGKTSNTVLAVCVPLAVVLIAIMFIALAVAIVQG